MKQKERKEIQVWKYIVKSENCQGRISVLGKSCKSTDIKREKSNWLTDSLQKPQHEELFFSWISVIDPHFTLKDR